MQIIEKSWGREEIIHNGDYCCKLLVYTRRIASSLHYHEKKHESFYMVSGLFELETCEGKVLMKPGMWHVLKPGDRHQIRCIEPGTIVESSSHDDPDDCIRLIPSES